MLKATDLTRAPLFDAVSFVLDDGERAGLVGPNGAGKTTLLRILAGVGRADRGAAAAGAHDRIGYLPQDVPDRRGCVGDLVGRSAGEAWTVRADLDRLEDRLAAGDASEATLAAYGRAQARFDALGGWALEARLDEVLRRLDVAHLDRRTPLARLSGGEAARVMLAGVLLAAPTVLLLDEPTNHLDLDGLSWLEEFLCGFGGTLLVVSHDRRFLDETGHQVLELDGTRGGLTAYAGGHTAYREERDGRRRRLALELEAQEKRRRRLAGDIERTRGFARRSRAARAPTSSVPTRRRSPRRRRRASGGSTAR
jgi:ATPase subunit of ABC transporter with duplicated ATPase domains